MERASLKESSATKNVKNEGWNQRKKAVEHDDYLSSRQNQQVTISRCYSFSSIKSAEANKSIRVKALQNDTVPTYLNDAAPQRYWLSSRWFQMLATGLPNDWVDQTMSYQLIQTTSFAMHPRLIEYNDVALDWMCCCLRLVVQSLVSNACDWNSHDWVDQTMSYQLIQTTSFAMHPRLIEYNAIALDWMCCCLRLVLQSLVSNACDWTSHDWLSPECMLTSSLLIPALVNAPLNNFFFDLFLQQTSQFLFQLVQLGLCLITNN
ncbi:hypothetical protein F511_22431 [Dorcoceras hygrometricum]|uniref:Uncharacterized protein n=1 Tax=Dorcoceras hygrometricum TaxID=472368 RepID=A0A2Z7CC89_9LAMI|nr:hypothetical protein F511_22431 [Dorcoceras hygrometricum]